MDLREYLFRENISNREFAKRIGYGPHYVGMIKNGRYNPGASFRLAIKKATDGKVTLFPPLKVRKNSKKKDHENQLKDEKDYIDKTSKRRICSKT